MLEQASSRGSEAGSLADRVSLAGLGSSKRLSTTASGRTGAAHSHWNPDADDGKPVAEDMHDARHDQSPAPAQASTTSLSIMMPPIDRPNFLPPQADIPPTFGHGNMYHGSPLAGANIHFGCTNQISTEGHFAHCMQHLHCLSTQATRIWYTHLPLQIHTNHPHNYRIDQPSRTIH